MCLNKISSQGKNSKMCIDVDLKERQNRKLLQIDYYEEYYEFLSKSVDICM